MEIKISYGITVCNEFVEIQRLISYLLKHKRKQDEIVVVYDVVNGSWEVEEFLRSHSVNNEFRWYPYSFDNNFADLKNYMTKLCNGEFLFNIDADEIPHENLINILPDILELNPNIEAYWVPRINTLDGDKEEILKYINSQRWIIDGNGYINKWDPQLRIYKSSPTIQWKGKLHESVFGFKTISQLPFNDEYSLYHHKTLIKQIKQNNLYNNM